MDEYDYEGEALRYLRDEAASTAQYEKWKSMFHSALFVMAEIYLPAVSRGDFMKVAYDIVDEEGE